MAHPKVANNNKKKNPSRDFKKEIIAKKKNIYAKIRATRNFTPHTQTLPAPLFLFSSFHETNLTLFFQIYYDERKTKIFNNNNNNK